MDELEKGVALPPKTPAAAPAPKTPASSTAGATGATDVADWMREAVAAKKAVMVTAQTFLDVWAKKGSMLEMGLETEEECEAAEQVVRERIAEVEAEGAGAFMSLLVRVDKADVHNINVKAEQRNKMEKQMLATLQAHVKGTPAAKQKVAFKKLMRALEKKMFPPDPDASEGEGEGGDDNKLVLEKEEVEEDDEQKDDEEDDEDEDEEDEHQEAGVDDDEDEHKEVEDDDEDDAPRTPLRSSSTNKRARQASPGGASNGTNGGQKAKTNVKRAKLSAAKSKKAVANLDLDFVVGNTIPAPTDRFPQTTTVAWRRGAGRPAVIDDAYIDLKENKTFFTTLSLRLLNGFLKDIGVSGVRFPYRASSSIGVAAGASASADGTSSSSSTSTSSSTSSSTSGGPPGAREIIGRALAESAHNCLTELAKNKLKVGRAVYALEEVLPSLSKALLVFRKYSGTQRPGKQTPGKQAPGKNKAKPSRQEVVQAFAKALQVYDPCVDAVRARLRDSAFVLPDDDAVSSAKMTKHGLAHLSGIGKAKTIGDVITMVESNVNT